MREGEGGRDSPVGAIVAVELGQHHFLQLDLELLVLPLQVHDDAVQEVDLTTGWESKSHQRYTTSTG